MRKLSKPQWINLAICLGSAAAASLLFTVWLFGSGMAYLYGFAIFAIITMAQISRSDQWL